MGFERTKIKPAHKQLPLVSHLGAGNGSFGLRIFPLRTDFGRLSSHLHVFVVAHPQTNKW